MSPTDHWTSDPRFSHFWTSYKVGRSWYTRHETAYWKSKAFATNYENQILKCLLAKSYQEVSGGLLKKLFRTLLVSPYCNCLKEKSKSNIASGTNIHEGAVASSQCATLSDLDGDIEMDISDEMLEFFTLSIKHRNERSKSILNCSNFTVVHLGSVNFFFIIIIQEQLI